LGNAVLSGLAQIQHDAYQITWSVPLPNFVKYNLDAAFHELADLTSWGACCKDEKGAFVLAVSDWDQPRVVIF